MDIRSSLAADIYARAKPATDPKPLEGDAAALLRDVAGDFAAQLKSVETAAQSTMVGDADPHALVEAMAQTQLAVETAATVRDRVVEAYQEILRMPV